MTTREKVILDDVCASAAEQPSKAAPMAATNCRDNIDAMRLAQLESKSAPSGPVRI